MGLKHFSIKHVPNNRIHAIPAGGKRTLIFTLSAEVITFSNLNFGEGDEHRSGEKEK